MEWLNSTDGARNRDGAVRNAGGEAMDRYSKYTKLCCC